MKLELKYECDPTLYGDEEDIDYALCENTDISEGVFNTYEKLLAFAIKHWDYRAYGSLYITVPDDAKWSKSTKEEIDNLNEQLQNDLEQDSNRKIMLEQNKIIKR